MPVGAIWLDGIGSIELQIDLAVQWRSNEGQYLPASTSRSNHKIKGLSNGISI